MEEECDGVPLLSRAVVARHALSSPSSCADVLLATSVRGRGSACRNRCSQCADKSRSRPNGVGSGLTPNLRAFRQRQGVAASQYGGLPVHLGSTCDRNRVKMELIGPPNALSYSPAGRLLEE